MASIGGLGDTVEDRPITAPTVKFEGGTTKTLRVRTDLDLGKHKAGEKVVFQFTEMIAISVVKP